MVVKTFRGLLVDGGQERIRLQTINGKVGYRIVKFEAMPEKPGLVASESVLQIFTKEVTATGEVDFSNQDLLGAVYVNNATGGHQYPSQSSIIFDNEIFNQDIYITHIDSMGSGEANYYIELEVIPLASDEATVATLKDIRLNA